MKNFHTWCIILGILLLVILIRHIGFDSLGGDLLLLGWGIIPLILIEGVADIFHTLGWRHCLSGNHRSIPFFNLYCIRMAGYSINYLTPTAGLGGEVTKGSLLAMNNNGAQAATAVIIDKLSYALSQLLFVVMGSIILLWKIDFPSVVWISMIAGSIILGGGILGFLVVQKYGKLGIMVRWLADHRIGGKALKKAATHITRIDNELKSFYREYPRGLPASMLWHAVGFVCGIVQSWLFFSILTDNPSLLMAAGVWFLGTWMDLIGFALPTNIGVIEATRILAFRLLGFDAAMGLTFGIALRMEQVFWAVTGLLIYAVFILKLSSAWNKKWNLPWRKNA